ncbi:aspartate--tRNA(Asn) ligase [Candidatus Nomurabacteria bacterium RIFCSPLOWO2_02_40_28]|uniref:Aspartyl-tRNA synthetase 2 n=2 Tax=Candidatus Nomuraibacteriota TaxID=1752729 RepID=A0A837HWX6_9BACT|nr:MAG: Aspartyl-tRNA synthetase 2 [Candidatus Nomurabacteria bacterium GW2011_GWD2_39_12]KKR20908.1 MAG: Aspartyl-tRNA synthetase 2 [Candidatus Nomurabacteria bacterium GW2011_GWC2_39_41]KKR37213.1 MAG: Aspartyl-tRNA synthetase 2 [Candidatus Nomurabacteria bacterium GW2011_GWE2_40_10]KKR38857.1 MAG: Aspartyl-tRNA synthetase 2 [Candidatus Nomurabacteria bacterium GW2011_GWB1_40_11]KKR40055.1 MAG: Aspartyl-tRNA synthetase 2 [Parcubacteria group bacterium GW2011_GWC1_40_11]KKR59244.1 MAG: Aspart
MKDRIYIKDLKGNVGKEVVIAGWVDVRRDQGKMVFFDMRDVTGKVQAIAVPNRKEVMEIAGKMRPEWVLKITGIVNKRPEKNIKAGVVNGNVELEVTNIEVLSQATELPFALDAELNFDTYLDYLPLTLRTERARDIFTMQATILDAYRKSLQTQNFSEFEAPAIVGGDAEGGAAAFKVDYYYDQTAYLATSPQFYKQIMVGPFERAFTVAKIFRAEKSATTRHLSEATCLDFEMGFIENELEPMKVLENAIRDTVKIVGELHGDMFARFNTTVPEVPTEIPIFTLAEAQALIAKEFKRTIEDSNDMSPEDERQICEYAKKNLKSDFVFITRFPTKKRAFYTYEEPSETPYSRGFDLLFRGLEINSGAQRIHNYEDLVRRIIERGMNPEKFSYYLQTFKYGMPPHGGSSTGLERFTARMLELPNVKEATAFPRDMNRIDIRLSE